MSDEQHITDEHITFGILHSAILQTGSDVRALGAKVDQLVTIQSANHLQSSTELTRLRTVDDAQQVQINEIKANEEKRGSNRLAVWGVLMGAGAIVAGIAQAIILAVHR